MRNYLSEMLYALTSAYTRKDYNNRRRDHPIETNIGKLFAILAWGLDSVEEQTELIKLWEDIRLRGGRRPRPVRGQFRRRPYQPGR